MVGAMTSTCRRSVAVLVAAVAVSLAACGDGGGTAPAAETSDAAGKPEEVDLVATDEAPCPTSGEEWEVAKLYIEHNATDEDTGVHGLIGGEAWRELCVFDPAGGQIWFIDPRAQLHDLAVSDFFFESREPEASEYSVDDLLRDFPEGTYVVAGPTTRAWRASAKPASPMPSPKSRRSPNRSSRRIPRPPTRRWSTTASSRWRGSRSRRPSTAAR